MNTRPFTRISLLAIFTLFFFSTSFSLNSTQQFPVCSYWNLESNFRIFPNQENPNRDDCGNYVWYFMKSQSFVRNPSTYSLLPNYRNSIEGIVGLQGWYDNIEPSISKNTTNLTQFPWSATWPPNVIHVHDSTNSLIVIGWKSPITGNIRISGHLIDMDNHYGNGIGWSLDKETTNLASGVIIEGGGEYYQQGLGGNILDRVFITKGQYIYLSVDPNGEYGYDSTGVSLTIQEIFSKSTPADAASGVSINPTLSWTVSFDATNYEYCFDTIDNTICDEMWMNAGLETNVVLTDLMPDNTYFWQVRANSPGVTTYANSGEWWHFTTSPLPGAFSKTMPVDHFTGLSLSPTLTWASSSNATDYVYCYDTIDNAICDGMWLSAGQETSVALTGLAPETSYSWQVRASGLGGTTYANNDTWWRFTTSSLPGAFNKTTPQDAAGGISVNPTLSWMNSNDATSYEYCMDTTDNDTCDGAWVSVGISTSVTLIGLHTNSTYFWQVRAKNPAGTTYANNGTWWHFTTVNKIWLSLVVAEIYVWEIEPNNTFQQANGPLVSGIDYFGYPNDQQDYFIVNLPVDGILTVDLSNHTGQGVQLQLFYESISNRVADITVPPYHITYIGQAGWYYVYIYTKSGFNNTMPYTLQVTYP